MKVLRNSLVLAALMVCGMTQAVPASDKNNDATEIAAFHKQLTDSLSMANVVTWNIPSELEPNAKMNFYLGVKGDKPENGYPVFLYLHGSGPRANEWATGLKLAKYFNDGPSMYIVPQIPQEGEWYRWWQRSKQWAWERILRIVMSMPEVDKNRIYVFGISEGGYGSQRLASFYGDYWAAAGPMAGGEPLVNAPVENLAHVPLSFLTGDRDFMFYRYLLTKTTGEKLDSMQHIHPNEYVHRVKLLEGYGHSIDYTPTTPWLAKHKRNAQPRHYIWENFEMDGLKRNAFYNLQVLEEESNYRTQYEFTANADNSIDLKVDTVEYITTWKDPRWGISMLFDKKYTPAQHGHVRLFLSDQLVDLGKKVVVRINGKEVFNGKVKGSKKNQKLSQELWADPMRDFKHAVEVKW
jgi:predicted esterase